MEALVSHSKKRKRDDATSVSISVAPPSDAPGPVLAIFPAVQPPADTAFQAYREKRQNQPEGGERQELLKGSTRTMEYTSTNLARSRELACQYLVGVYDKAAQKVRVYSAPTHVMSGNVKALKNRPKPASEEEQRAYRAQRNELGETFGSRKTIKGIRAVERNQVDISALQGVAGHMQDAIDTGTSALPSKDEMKATMEGARPIPPVNENATSPSEVYNVSDVVPDTELKSISVQPFVAASTNTERRALLGLKPKPKAQEDVWAGQHLNRLFEAAKLDRESLKLLVVVVSMMNFRRVCMSILDKNGRSKVEERLQTVPPLLLDGLFIRFTEKSRASEEEKFTAGSETRLLTHMFSLCLRLDRWTTVTGIIAHDLKMEPAKVMTLFKTLGCRREQLSAEARKRKGISFEEDQDRKSMQLKLPLVFPTPPGRRKERT